MGNGEEWIKGGYGIWGGELRGGVDNRTFLKPLEKMLKIQFCITKHLQFNTETRLLF